MKQTLIKEPGIYPGIPASEYHKDPCPSPSLSSSIARLLLQKSPLHARLAHPRLGAPPVDEPHKFDIGNAAHALLLEDQNGIEVIDAPDWRTADAKKLRDYARANGKYPLLKDQAVRVYEMVQSTRAQLAERGFQPFDDPGGQPEVTVAWEEDGLWFRIRPDWLTPGVIWDYKTTGNANPAKWERIMYSLAGDLQNALYVRGMRAVGSTTLPFRWAVQETEPPYALSVMALSPHGVELAERKLELAIATWRKCLESNTWPGYPAEVCYVSPPSWEESEQTRRELSTEESRAAFELGMPL